MTIDDEILRRGYWYILQHPKGYLSELDEINENLTDYLSAMGIIAYGINSKAALCYQITPKGEEIARIDYTSITLKFFRQKNGISN